MSVYDQEKEKEQSTPGNDGDNSTADNIRGLEDSFGAKDAEYPEGHPSKSKEQSALDSISPGKSPLKPPIQPTDMYNPTAAIAKGAFSRFYANVGNNKKSVGIGGGIVGVIIIAIIAGFSAFLPFELLHIKEVAVQELSGVQEQVMDKRRMRIMTRAYFFRDGKLDGYKARGSMFSFVENRKSTKIVADLETRGYKIKPELDANGNYTGRFKEIIGPDGKVINDGDSLWQRRSALRTAMNDVYPAKTALWRSKQTSKMYARYGLVRGKWWSDNAATRKLASAEERLKQKIRDTMNKPVLANGQVDPVPDKKQDGTADPAGQKANTAAGELADGIDAAAQEEYAAANSGTETAPLAGNPQSPDLAIKPGKAFAEGILNVIKITGPIDGACQGISAANTISKVSRVQKALQLAKYSSLILSMADGLKAGKVDSKSLNEMMTAMNKPDPETGKSFFASAGWQTLSTHKQVTGAYTTTYNSSGGTSGEIKNILDKFYGLVGGKSNVKTTCGTLNNPFIQVGSGVLGIGAAIFTGGAEAAAKLPAQAAIELGKQFIIGYATQLGVKAATGTIVSGAEKGERMGDAFSSGAGTMTALNASSRGFKPLTKSQFTAQKQEYLAYQATQFNALPLKEKILSSENQNSVAYKSMSGVAMIQNKGIIGTIASIPKSLFSFGNLNAKAASQETPACTDEDIVANNIQTDGFCNPIMGNTDDELDKIDPIENMIWMQDNGYVDGDGKPLGVFADYTKFCFNDEDGTQGDKVSVLFSEGDYVSEFTSECFDAGTTTGYVANPANSNTSTVSFFSKLFSQKATAASNTPTVRIGLHERFRAFRLDTGIIECTNDFLDNGYCNDQVGGSDSSSDGSTTSPTASRFGPFIFPLQVNKDTITSNKPAWCYKTQDVTCHGTESYGYYASDIFVKAGVPVVSATDGVVVNVKPSSPNKAGSATEALITIKANDCDDTGTKLTCIGKGTVFWYGHLQPNSQKVKEGDKVTSGQIIATSGGAAQGDGIAHLHIDATDRKNDFRGACARETPDLCKALGFINIQPELYAAFNNIGTAAGVPATQGWVWPLNGTITINSCFAQPLSKGLHPGLDLRARTPLPVIAIADGTVYGNVGGNFGIIKIKHSDALYSVYEHLSSISVTPGQSVKKGDVIGKTGSVGATAPHLHFGITTDPNVFEYSQMGLGKILNPLTYVNGGKDYMQCSAQPAKA